MNYISTRGNNKKVSAAEAIKTGMVPAGGLFVPETFPLFTKEELETMVTKNYQDIAQMVFEKYLTDFTKEEISACVTGAYNNKNFTNEKIAPIVKNGENFSILELWHGPTAAFKDMALQIMPYFLTTSKKKLNDKTETVILVATSGDTGKAALEGFKNIEGIRIIVFYPVDGVSEVQKLQMATTEGNNVDVIAVEGNFDDCQTAVKNIFGDEKLKEKLKNKGIEFSSANSINWGRLLPQIAYYFSAYSQMVISNEIKFGEEVDFSVPTGNFGNILAGYYAKKMGLPVKKFICASNKNNVLSDFFKTGKYDRKREFYKTMSPSMDILISSNLERFIFDISGCDGKLISKLYNDLASKGEFEVDSNLKAVMDSLIVGDYCNEDETSNTIKNIYEKTGYVLDTHTAVAYKAAIDKFDGRKIIIDSTASPYKFSNSVVKSINDKEYSDEFDAVVEIEKLSGMKIHRALEGLKNKKVLFSKVVKKSEVEESVKNILKV